MLAIEQDSTNGQQPHDHQDHAHAAATTPALSLQAITAPRTVSPQDRTRFEENIGEIFASLGMDLNTPGTAETPRRFLQAMIDATAGYEGDPKLVTVFPTECHGDAHC